MHDWLLLFSPAKATRKNRHDVLKGNNEHSQIFLRKYHRARRTLVTCLNCFRSSGEISCVNLGQDKRRYSANFHL